MTAANIELEEQTESDDTTASTGINENGTDKKEEIVDFLSRNEKIFFKSQQIDDPDLTIDEKRVIARNIFDESHSKFLLRFGKYLQSEHLSFFAMNSYVEEEEEYEIKFLLRDFEKELKNRAQNVKNRRYAAIKAMMKEDEYFSELEMMRREPHLYEQLVGQYLTETEKRIRDGYDPKNTPFSQILLDKLDKERTENLKKMQEDDDDSASSSPSSHASCKTPTSENEDLYPRTPPSYRKQWGNFEDDPSSSSNHKPKKEKPQKYITAGEREMLRQEFIGIMHAKFLDGLDKDFDYSKVDDNPELDDLNQISQDNEDKYFDDDDGDDSIGREILMEQDEDSQDDLDIFMHRLHKNSTMSANLLC